MGFGTGGGCAFLRCRVITCPTYTVGEVEGVQNSAHLLFNIQDDCSSNFFVPKNVLHVLVSTALKIRMQPDDIVAIFMGMLNSEKKRNLAVYNIEMYIYPPPT